MQSPQTKLETLSSTQLSFEAGLGSPVEAVEYAKQAMIDFAYGKADVWEKEAAVAKISEFTTDEINTINDTSSQALISYARLGIEPQDASDVENNLFKSWFETDEEYDFWLKKYESNSQFYSEPKLAAPPDSSVEMINEVDDSPFRSRKAILGSGALIGATFMALAFEQSPGNESVRAAAALEVLENTSDPIAAGIMVAGLTVVIEGVTGGLIAGGLNRERKILKPKLERFRNKLIKDQEQNENSVDKSKVGELVEGLTDTGITCTIGPGMVVARRHFQETDRTFGKDMKTLAGYTGVGAGVSGLIGYLATGGVKHADKVGLGTPAEYFVDYATDWKFWTGLLVFGYGGKWTYGKIRNMFKREKNQDLKMDDPVTETALDTPSKLQEKTV